MDPITLLNLAASALTSEAFTAAAGSIVTGIGTSAAWDGAKAAYAKKKGQELASSKESDLLANQDLRRCTGRALQLLLKQLQASPRKLGITDPEDRKALERSARVLSKFESEVYATEAPYGAWAMLCEDAGAQVDFAALMEDALPERLEGWAEAQTDARDSPLPMEGWEELFVHLYDRIRGPLDEPLGDDLLNILSRAAQENFESFLILAFKEDAETGGRAFAGLQLMLSGRLYAVSSEILNTLQAFEKSVEGRDEAIELIEGLIVGLRAEIGDMLSQLQYLEEARQKEFETILDSLARIDASIQTIIARQFEWIIGQITEYFDRSNDPDFEHIPRGIVLKQGAELEALWYRSQAFEFKFRETELEQLHEFAKISDSFCWWAIVGPGGVGKSRLGLQFAIELRRCGWDAGFVKSMSPWLGNVGAIRTWNPTLPTLLIVDYPTGRSDEIATFLSAIDSRMSRDPFRVPVRLLLLDRQGSQGAWFLKALTSRGNVPEGLIRSAPKYLYRRKNYRQVQQESISDTDFIQLSRFRNREEWKELLEATLSALRSPTNLDHLEEKGWDNIARVTGNGLPLYLQICAILIAKHGIEVIHDSSTEKLLDEILKIELGESGRWADLFPDEAIRLCIARAAGFTTLCRDIELDSEAYRTLKATACWPPTNPKFKEMLLQLLIAESGKNGNLRIEGLAPDLLGERYLLCGGQPFDQRDPIFDIREWLDSAMNTNSAGLAKTLALLARDFPKDTTAPNTFREILQSRAHLPPDFFPHLLAVLGAQL